MNSKFTLLLGLLTFSFVSCKKDLTCTCTITESTSGNSYDYISQYDSWTGTSYYYQTSLPLTSSTNTSSSEVTYVDVNKGAAASQCPEKYVYTEDFDYTYETDYTDNVTGQMIIYGSKGKSTTTQTCKLEKN